MEPKETLTLLNDPLIHITKSNYNNPKNDYETLKIKNSQDDFNYFQSLLYEIKNMDNVLESLYKENKKLKQNLNLKQNTINLQNKKISDLLKENEDLKLSMKNKKIIANINVEDILSTSSTNSESINNEDDFLTFQSTNNINILQNLTFLDIFEKQNNQNFSNVDINSMVYENKNNGKNVNYFPKEINLYDKQEIKTNNCKGKEYLNLKGNRYNINLKSYQCYDKSYKIPYNNVFH